MVFGYMLKGKQLAIAKIWVQIPLTSTKNLFCSLYKKFAII